VSRAELEQVVKLGARLVHKIDAARRGGTPLRAGGSGPAWDDDYPAELEAARWALVPLVERLLELELGEWEGG
jgi:hypothetical protein